MAQKCDIVVNFDGWRGRGLHLPLCIVRSLLGFASRAIQSKVIGFEYQRALKMFQCFHARDFSVQTRLNYNYIVCPLNQKLPIVQGLSLDRLWNLGSWDGNLHIDSDRRHWLNSCYKILETFHEIFRIKLKSNSA